MNLNEIESRIGQMEQELSNLRQAVAQLKGAPAAAAPPRPAPAPKPPGRFAVFLQSLREENMEIFLGGNVLGKLGILAIVLATMWFIKLAFDNQWVNESGRIYTGILLGFAIMAAAAALGRRLMRVVPAPLLGAGISVLYVSVFSAYHYYGLLEIQETFAAMVLLSAYATFLSVISNKQSLYVFGLLGAFLAPVMLSRGENSYRFLFTYTALIQAGYLWVSTRRVFTLSGYMVLIGSAVTWGAWSVAYMEKSNYWVPLAILIFTFVVFFARQMFVSFVHKAEDRVIDFALLPGSLLFLAGAGYTLTHHHYNSATGHFLLLCAWLLVACILIVHRWSTKQPQSKTPSVLFPLLAYETLLIVFASITDFFDGREMTFAWILFASALSLSSVRLKKELPLVLSVLAWVLVLFRMVFIEYSMYTHWVVLNPRFALFVAAGIGLTLTYLLHKRAPFASYVKGFAFAAMFSFIWGALLENHDAIESRHYRNLGYSYVLAAYALVFLVYGFSRNHKTLRLSGIALAGLVVAKLYFWDIWTMSRLVRIIAGFSLGIALIVLSILYQKYRERIIQIGKTLMIFTLAPLALFLAAAAAPNSLYAEKFRKESYRNRTEIQPVRPGSLLDKSIGYGKLTLTPELVRTGNSSMRVSYRGKALPSFLRRVEEDSASRGEYVPQVLFSEFQRDSSVYVLKLPEPPEGTVWQELHLASQTDFEAGVHVQASDEPRDWNYIGHRSVFRYGGKMMGDSGLTVRVDAGRARYLRLEFTRSIGITFTKILYAKKGPDSVPFEIAVDQWKRSSDSDRQATVLEFANPERRKIERLVLSFKQPKFQRFVEVYTFNEDTRSYQLNDSAYLSRRKGDKEEQVLDLGFAATSALKLVIVDGDDEPLELTQSRAYSPLEQIVFRLPEDAAADEPIIVYSGNKYVEAPRFDIGDTFDEKAVIAEFRAAATQENDAFAYSALEPPVSSWIMRIAFIVGLLALGLPCYRIFRKYADQT